MIIARLTLQYKIEVPSITAVYLADPCPLAHTLPDNPSVPPRRHISSSWAGVRSHPIAPCTSTAIPRGRLSSCVTEISTSPEIGVRSGDDITILGPAAGTSSNRLSAGARAGRETFTGILRGAYVPMGAVHQTVRCAYIWRRGAGAHLIRPPEALPLSRSCRPRGRLPPPI